jgi:hypothetical protein
VEVGFIGYLYSQIIPTSRRMNQKQLTLAFLTPEENDHWLNKLASYVSNGYCHVELIFDAHKANHTNKALAFSVQSGEYVRLKGKSFKNPRYDYVTLSVPAQQYDSAYAFAESATKKQIAFSNLDMSMSLVHPGACAHTPSLESGHSFCSKIIAETLQNANCPEVDSLCPSSTTPGSLFNAVCRSQRRVTTCIKLKTDTPSVRLT